MKRVKQISVDILVDENTDGCALAEMIARDLEAEGTVVLGSNFQDDLTALYKREYPELLGEQKEETDAEFWGEEICPHCDYVNQFVCDGVTRKIICKECGEEILLCSLCDMDKVDCSKCPYEEEN